MPEPEPETEPLYTKIEDVPVEQYDSEQDGDDSTPPEDRAAE